MGMTIDEVIQSLTAMKSVIGVNQLTINEAIENMRKYQKIEQAYKKYQNDMVTNIYADSKFIRTLGEVLEDGKVD